MPLGTRSIVLTGRVVSLLFPMIFRFFRNPGGGRHHHLILDADPLLSFPSLPGEDSQFVSYQLVGQHTTGISKVCLSGWLLALYCRFCVPRLTINMG
jgi:hypothetical protein